MDTPQPNSRRPNVGTILSFCLAATCLILVASHPSSFAQEKATAEVTSEERESAFKVQVERNLVLVRAVVRDGRGKPVGNLRKEDFRLLDNGKPQAISHFSLEIPSAKIEEQARQKAEASDSEAPGEDLSEPTTAERFLAIFLDDVHVVFDDLARTQAAADRYLETALQPGDRVGIFTTSGEHSLDFTDDRAKLHEALMRIRPRSIVPRRDNACPDISDYQAYQIVHEHDPFAIEIATEEAFICYYQNRGGSEAEAMALARTHAEGDAVTALSSYQTETVYALRTLDAVIRRLAVMPGQRTVVVASPGFLMQTQESQVSRLIERALRSNVVINTLDAKGLYASIPFGDASQNPAVLPRRIDLTGKKQQLLLRRAEIAAEVLRVLAADTGGVFFHNSNDLQEGFRRVGALPDMYYVLGFSPQNLKLDGRFHTLKVALNTKEKYSIQARNGYYAPAKPVDPASQAKEEIEQAIFSRDELNELPIEIQTQFFKTSDVDVKLSVLTRLDLRFVQFRKEGGRNRNSLTIVAVLFDRDGKYVTGKEKQLHLQLLDASLEKLLRSGVTAKLIFDVHPGTYMVRQVVRDAEGAQLTAINRTVDIPY